jgi:hypothetical protein
METGTYVNVPRPSCSAEESIGRVDEKSLRPIRRCTDAILPTVAAAATDHSLLTHGSIRSKRLMKLARCVRTLAVLGVLGLVGFVVGCGSGAQQGTTTEDKTAIADGNKKFYQGLKAKKSESTSPGGPRRKG